MSKTLVLDLATHLGYAIIEDNKIIESGDFNLAKRPRTIKYISSKKRKTIPPNTTLHHNVHYGYHSVRVEGLELDYYYDWRINEDEWYLFQDGYWYLIKEKTIIDKFTLKEQLERLYDWSKLNTNNTSKIVVEAPAVPFGSININSLRKQFGLYSIVELKGWNGIDKEIRPNEWFSWIKNEFPPYNVFVEKNGKRKIDRKATSKLIANVIMKDINGLEKEIKDDNEADAICIAYYEIKNGEGNE